MKVIKKFIIYCVILTSSTFALASCANKNVIDIKSPCVSLDSGPCGPKRPINDWWLKTNV